MVANFFSVDFQTLDPEERTLLEEVARDGTRSRRDLAQSLRRTEDATEPLLYGLGKMGYLSEKDGAFRIGNWFFDRWLRRVMAGARP